MNKRAHGTVVDLSDVSADITKIINKGYNVILMDNEDYGCDFGKLEILDREMFVLFWFVKD